MQGKGKNLCTYSFLKPLTISLAVQLNVAVLAAAGLIIAWNDFADNIKQLKYNFSIVQAYNSHLNFAMLSRHNLKELDSFLFLLSPGWKIILEHILNTGGGRQI